MNSTNKGLDSKSTAPSVATKNSGMSCACGPACKCDLLSFTAKSFELWPSADWSVHTEGAGPVTVIFESGLGDTDATDGIQQLQASEPTSALPER